MTRGDLIRKVAADFGLEVDAGSAELLLLQEWANEAVIEILVETHVHIDMIDVQLTAGYAEYRLPSTILAIDNGRGSTPAGIGPYVLVGMADMLDLQAAAPVATGPRKYIAIEGDFMVVTPTPQDSETLRFYHVPEPTPMTDDSQDPSNAVYGGIPVWAHRAIEAYMKWKAADYDDKGGGFWRGHAFAPGAAYKDIFDGECALIKARKKRMRGRVSVMPRVGYPDTWKFPGRRNDTYPTYPDGR